MDGLHRLESVPAQRMAMIIAMQQREHTLLKQLRIGLRMQWVTIYQRVLMGYMCGCQGVSLKKMLVGK